MIDFNKIEIKEMPEFKGGTGVTRAHMFTNDQIKIMRMHFHPGDSIGKHVHESNCEIMYVISGRARIILDGVEEYVEAGQAHYCPMGHKHALFCDGPEELVLFATVPEQKL